MHREAIQDFNQAIQYDPKDDIAFNGRGNALFSLGEFKEAIQDFTVAVQLDHKDAIALGNRAYARVKLGKLSEADPDIKQAIRLDPKYGYAHAVAGVIKFLKKEYQDCIIPFVDANTCGYKDGLLLKACAYYKMDEYSEALKTLNEYLAINETTANLVAYLLIAYIKHKTTQLVDKATFSKATTLLIEWKLNEEEYQYGIVGYFRACVNDNPDSPEDVLRLLSVFETIHPNFPLLLKFKEGSILPLLPPLPPKPTLPFIPMQLSSDVNKITKEMENVQVSSPLWEPLASKTPVAVQTPTVTLANTVTPASPPTNAPSNTVVSNVSSRVTDISMQDFLPLPPLVFWIYSTPL